MHIPNATILFATVLRVDELPRGASSEASAARSQQQGNSSTHRGRRPGLRQLLIIHVLDTPTCRIYPTRNAKENCSPSVASKQSQSQAGRNPTRLAGYVSASVTQPPSGATALSARCIRCVWPSGSSPRLGPGVLLSSLIDGPAQLLSQLACMRAPKHIPTFLSRAQFIQTRAV